MTSSWCSLPTSRDTDADGLASRIREAMRSPFVLSVGQVFSSASIGVATATTGDRARLHALLGEADEAMYASKQAGRDATTRFDVSMRLRTERRLQLERMLHEALDADALTVAYQPIVTGASWSICGFEALVRWTVDGTPIHPDEFIPVAEESGLIVPLGEFVLDAACAELARWRRTVAGAEVFAMSVNLSPRQIGSGDIVEVVADALARHDLPGDAHLARDHRERDGRGQRHDRRGVRRAASARCAPVGRRLRHGVLVVELPQAVPGVDA